MTDLWDSPPFQLGHSRAQCLLSPEVCWLKLSTVIISGSGLHSKLHHIFAEMFSCRWPERLTSPWTTFSVSVACCIISCHIGLFLGKEIWHLLIMWKGFWRLNLHSVSFCVLSYETRTQFLIRLLYFQHFLCSLRLNMHSRPCSSILGQIISL